MSFPPKTKSRRQKNKTKSRRQKNKRMSCVYDKRDHNLIVIDSRSRGYGCIAVTRWCIKCGGVVVDEDIDGRVAPGSLMPMCFPQAALDAAKAIHSTRVERNNLCTSGAESKE